jgi:hypothetical protein
MATYTYRVRVSANQKYIDLTCFRNGHFSYTLQSARFSPETLAAFNQRASDLNA